MRDRLIELIKHNTADFINPFAYEYVDNAERFADHLLANGVIVPPCKVGDTVWEIDSDNPFEEDFRVMETKVEKYFVGTRLGIHLIDNFGKTVFLTKEEAEKALKEREKV